MIKYKIGDRVMNVSDSLVPKNSCGTVSFTTVLGDIIGITWDEIGFHYTHKDLIAPLIDVKIDTNYNINPAKICQSITSVLEQYGVGLTLKNGKTLEVKKEKESMLNLEFKTEEGYRIDKTCNKQIPTIKTTVSSRTVPWRNGVATCDKTDYSERQGVIEALANLICNGNFDREFNKAVKKNKLVELHDRTCIYCGKVFDTVEELRAHEAWHVERKKARRERYLLRKRAKEIAFEEQAQKMAKDMFASKKND